MRQEYLNSIKAGAIEGWYKYKITPSLTAAQAALESGWGTSKLAAPPYNNNFGIKAGADWAGKTASMSTQEWNGSKFITTVGTFRAYDSINDSVEDHGLFFTSTEWRINNYRDVVGEGDYKKACYAVAKAGYATDPNYASKLINIIETYNLQSWDVEAQNGNPNNEALENTRASKIVGGSISSAASQSVSSLLLSVIGDSLGVGTEKFLNKYPWAKASYDNVGSRQWTHSTASLDATKVLQTMINNNNLQQNVVFILGTNRGVNAEEIDNVVSMCGRDRNIILVDTASEVNHRNTVSNAYREASKRHQNVFYANWSDYARANIATWYHADGANGTRIHMKDAGYQKHAEFIIQAVYEAVNTNWVEEVSTPTERNTERINIYDIEYDDGKYTSPKGDSSIYNKDLNDQLGFRPKKAQIMWIERKYTGEEDNAADLLEAALKKMDEYSVPAAQYTVPMRYFPDEVSIGDTGYFIDHEFNPPLYIFARVLSVTTSVSNPANDSVVIGNVIEVHPKDKADILALQKELQENREEARLEYWKLPPIVLQMISSNGLNFKTKPGELYRELVHSTIKEPEVKNGFVDIPVHNAKKVGARISITGSIKNNYIDIVDEITNEMNAPIPEEAFTGPVDPNSNPQGSVVKDITAPLDVRQLIAKNLDVQLLDSAGLNMQTSILSVYEDSTFALKVEGLPKHINKIRILSNQNIILDDISALDTSDPVSGATDKTRLYVKAFQQDTEVTHKFKNFSWTRISSNKRLDEEWNDAHKFNETNGIDLMPADVFGNESTFVCKMFDESGKFVAATSSSVTITQEGNKNTVSDSTMPPINPSPGDKWTAINGDSEEEYHYVDGEWVQTGVSKKVDAALEEAEQAKEDAQKAYEEAVAEAKRAADEADALIRTEIEREISEVETEMTTAKQEAIEATNKALEDAKAHAIAQDKLITESINKEIADANAEILEAKEAAEKAYEDAVADTDAKIAAKDLEYEAIFDDYDEQVATIGDEATQAKTKADQALEEAGISTDLAQTAKDLADTAKTNAQTALSNASKAQTDALAAVTDASQAKVDASKAVSDASKAVSDANQAKADASKAQEDAQTAITESGKAVDSANAAKTDAQTAIEDAQTALSTAKSANTKSGLVETAANTAKANAQTALDNSSTAITNAANAITKAGQAETTANTAKTNAQTSIDDAQEALTVAGKAKTTADTLSVKVDDLEGEVELKASQTEVDGISGTVSTHTTTLSQQAAAIASKADKTVVDTLSGTVSNQGTLISQNATAISSKASSELVNTIKDTVDTHTTEISQNAKAIESKASSTSVTNLTGRVKTAETTITQHATSIASKANQTEVDTVKGTVSGHTTTLSQHAKAISSKAESELVNTIKGTVDTHTTEISQNAKDIASKASATSVDILTGTVSDHTTAISQNATAIKSKAEKSLVDTIKDTVDTHTTEISQNATDIASKASSTTVNTLTGRVDTAESNITQNATAITQRVTTNTYNAGIASKENTVLKQSTAPTHVNGRLWLDTSVTPNILKRSNGTAWIKATPTTPGEVGAYSQAAGAGLAGRLTTAETNITQTATAITSKADKSTVDTLAGTVNTQGTTITQQANLIASKADQKEVDTVKGTVSGHTTTISQHATQIASKAEKNLVDTIKGTVDTHTTDIRQNATDIASKASASSVNTLTGRVSTAESNIGQNATAISQRVTTTTYNAGIASKENSVLKQSTAPTHLNGRLWLDTSVTPNVLKRSTGTAWVKATPTTAAEVGAYSTSQGSALAGRVTTAETNITQTSEAITSKADKSVVDTLSGTVSGHTSTLSQHATQISARLTSSQVNSLVDGKGFATQTWANNQITASANGINANLTKVEGKIDGLQVGGRNLLKDSGKTISNGSYNIARYDLTDEIKQGEEVTLTIWGSLATTKTNFRAYNSGGNVHVTILTDNRDGTYSSTFKWTIGGSTNTYLNVYAFTNSQTGTSTINKIKLEKGNVGTDWSPAPEDTLMQNDFNTFKASYEATAEALTSRLTAVDKAGGRLATAESNISQNATAISARLTSSQVNSLVDGKGLAKVTYVDNKISATAENFGVELTRVEGEIPKLIGGVNLLTGTKDTNETKTWSGYDHAFLYTTNPSELNLEVGDYLTLRVYVANSNTRIIPILQFTTGSAGNHRYHPGVINRQLAVGESGWIESTVQYTQEIHDNVTIFLAGIRNVDHLTRPSTTTFKKAKLEKGKIATEWTPHISETVLQGEYKTFSSGITGTVNGILTRVTNIDKKDGKLDVLDAKIDTTASSITSTVSDVVKTIPTTNLHRNTSDEWRSTTWSGWNQWEYVPQVTSGGDELNVIDKIPIFENYDYTASVLYSNITGTSDVSIRIIWVMEDNSTVESANGGTISPGKGGYAVVTAKAPVGAKFAQVALRRVTLSGSTTVRYRQLKFEQGAKRTPWVVSHRDTEDNVRAVSQLTQTANRLTARIGSRGEKISEFLMTDSLFQTTILDNVSGKNYLPRSSYNGEWVQITGYDHVVMDETLSALELYPGDIMTFSFYAHSFEGAGTDIAAFWQARGADNSFVQGWWGDAMPANGRGWLRTTFAIPAKTNTGADVVRLVLSIRDFSMPTNRRGFYRMAKLEKGDKRTDWVPNNGDIANQTQITQLADSWAMRITSADSLVTEINATTAGVRIKGETIHLNGNTLIDNSVIQSAHINTLNASKITGNTADFNAIRAGVLTADAVTATHIKADNALIDNIFANQALVDRLWAKAIWTNKINAMSLDAARITSGTIATARLNASDIVTKGLTTDVVTATHIKSDTALIDNIFATQALVDRLWAKTIWTNKITAMSLNASQITAGTIDTARLNASAIVTAGLTANVVTATHIKSENALIDNIFANQALVDRLWAKTIWTNKISAISLDASQITAGTINAARIQTGSLDLNKLTVGARAGIVNSPNMLRDTSPNNQYAKWTGYDHRLHYQNGMNGLGLSANGGNLAFRLYIGRTNVDVFAFIQVAILNSNGTYTYRQFRGNAIPAGSTGWSNVVAQITKNDMDNGAQFQVSVRNLTTSVNGDIVYNNAKMELGNLHTVWSPHPDDAATKTQLGYSGTVEIHGGNIKADTLSVNAITGNTATFISGGVKGLNSNMSLDGGGMTIQDSAGNTASISSTPDFKAIGSDGTAVYMTKGNVDFAADGAQKFKIGTKVRGSQNGILINKNHGWALMRESSTFGGSPAQYHKVGNRTLAKGASATIKRSAVWVWNDSNQALYMTTNNVKGVTHTVETVGTGTFAGKYKLRHPTPAWGITGWVQAADIVETTDTWKQITTQYYSSSEPITTVLKLNGSNLPANTHASDLPELTVGMNVLVKNAVAGNTSGVGSVFEIWSEGSNNIIQFDYILRHSYDLVKVSDRKLKHDIIDSSILALDHIKSLTFKEYKWNRDGSREPIGLIAQDSGIIRMEGETEGINTTRAVMLGLKGVQELQKIVEAQAEKIKQLEEKINK